MKNAVRSTQKQQERVLIVIVEFKDQKSNWSTEDVLAEMKELVIACTGEFVDHVVCRLQKASSANLIGEGKVQEIKDVCALKNIDTVIFSHDLKGSHVRNLEEEIKVRIIDRTQLILDIFARRATSNEGKMQVELAQLEYLLPRLVGHGLEMSRLAGGIGTVGPGESKLEIDRRRIAEKITFLKRNLKDIVHNRNLKRKKRDQQSVPSLALVGYTNAGKSTLLNKLTDADQVTKDGLFTTLDSLARQLVLPNHQRVIISDTVGFMHDLPHHLIESFKATLEELQDADLLIHVLDISHPKQLNLFEAVRSVLKELNVFDKPTIIVLNKIDKLASRTWLQSQSEQYENSVCISALTGEGVDQLLSMIVQELSSLYVEINVDVPISRMDLVNLAHDAGEVYSIKYYSDTINIRASIPAHLVGKFQIK